jgi:hypothetical protein
MALETSSLLDDEAQALLRDGLTLHELYLTRILRIDRPPRASQDPLQRWVHKYLRFLRYWRLSQRVQARGPESKHTMGPATTHNIPLISHVISRVILAANLSFFLVVPLVLLAGQADTRIQMVIVCFFLLGFMCLVAAVMRPSNLELMMVAAAYAAILSVFVSNVAGPRQG